VKFALSALFFQRSDSQAKGRQLPCAALFLYVLLSLPAIADLQEFQECTIGNNSASMDALCADFVVALDPNTLDGETITLRVAKLAANTTDPKPDALTLISGGPGQSALDSFPSVAAAFSGIRAERDIYLLDQRGTGQSNKLACKNNEEDEALEFDAEKTRQFASDCLAELNIDTRFFTTSVAIHDLEKLRLAIGAPQWNVYGVSYGTRVALHYARRYHENVRSLILDAVVPPGVVLGPDIALNAQQSLERLFTRCEKDNGCMGAFPELRQGTLDLIESLKNAPRDVKYEDVTTGQLRSMTFNNNHLAVTLRLMSYSAYGNAILPSMLHDAYANENFAPLARQSRLQSSSIEGALAFGMHHSVICTEDEPFVPDDTDRAALNKTYLGSTLLDALKSNCDPWPAGVLDEDFRNPVQSDIPTLILSGTDDPITPPSYGEIVAKHLSKVKHVINENQGHVQAPLGCVPKIMEHFIDVGTTKALPVSCLDRLRAPSFFVDANGPLP